MWSRKWADRGWWGKRVGVRIMGEGEEGGVGVSGQGW